MPIANVQNLVIRVATLLSDPGGKWAKYDYLKNFILSANEDLNTELAAYNLSYNEKVVALPGIPANTADLSAYMAEGGLLENVMDPTVIEWKPQGEDDIRYQTVKKVDKVLDVKDATYPKSWEWRGSNIYISPCTEVVDLRVRFDAITLDISDPTSEVLRGSLNVLAYKTAELVSGSRGGLAGTGEPLAKYMERKCEEAKENFECLLVKRDQSKRRFFGRSSRRAGRAVMPPVIS